VVINDIFVPDGAIEKVFLNTSKEDFMMIQSSLRRQNRNNIKMSLIIGKLYVTDVNDEFPEIRFEKSWDSTDK